MPRSTLVTHVVVTTPTEVRRRTDVPLQVVDQRHLYTDIQLTLPDLGIDIRLTNGERIALIEALGGKATA